MTSTTATSMPIDPLVAPARAFAIKAHAGQLYGYEPYTVHLEAVHQVAVDFGLDVGIRAATFLHDTVEDTGTLLEQLFDLFGHDVASLVWAVTGEGETRADQVATAHAKILGFATSRAALLKLCDRIANVEASRRTSLRLWRRYREEQPAFDVLLDHHRVDGGEILERMRARLRLAFLVV